MADAVRSVKARAISTTTNAFDSRRDGAAADARTPERITDSGGVTTARRMPSGYLQSDWEFATDRRTKVHGR
jgi:hypothetical protein